MLLVEMGTSTPTGKRFASLSALSIDPFLFFLVTPFSFAGKKDMK